jgi:hypothetical protein
MYRNKEYICRMEELRDPLFRKLFTDGFVFGQNPVFADCEDIARSAPKYNNRAFLSGFKSGRQEYEKLNGKLCDGIPKKILTTKILAEFKLAGSLGMPIHNGGFNSRQRAHINVSYNMGREEYAAENDFKLFLLLADIGISIKNKTL